MFCLLLPTFKWIQAFFFQVKNSVTYTLIYHCFQCPPDFQILLVSCYFLLLTLAFKLWLLVPTSPYPSLTLDRRPFQEFQLLSPKSNPDSHVTHSVFIKSCLCKILRHYDALDGVTVDSSLSFPGCHWLPICVISPFKMPLQFVFSLLFPLPGRRRAGSVALTGVWNCSKSELEGRLGILLFQVRNLGPREEQGLTQDHTARR